MMSNTVKGQEFMENARLEHEYLEQVVKKNLKEKEDYLKTDSGKLCLLKSGAEKLCEYYGFSVQLELVESTGSHIKDMAMYTVKAILCDIDSGAKLAEGLGMASSQESRYQQQSSTNVANTILKMAKKRAMVDAVITAVHGSFLFTQDLEDIQSAYSQLNENTGSGQYQKKNHTNTNSNRGNGNSYSNKNSYGNNNRNTGYQSKSQSGNNRTNQSYGDKGNNQKSYGAGKATTNDTATDRQINLIEKLISQNRISRDQVCMELEKRFSTVDYRSLTKKQASDFIQALNEDIIAWAS